LRGAQDPTHLGRILHDLGIAISRRAPEAKGRVERPWRTLQDRLTSELRLRHITTPEAANAFCRSSCGTQCTLHPDPGGRRPPGAAPRARFALVSAVAIRRVARDNTVHRASGSSSCPAPTSAPQPLSRRAPGTARWPPRRACRRGRPRHASRRPRLQASSPTAPPEFHRRHPAQRPDPLQSAFCERAAPHGSGSTRQTSETSSTPPPKPRAARPAARHPWRKAITKKAQALYPVPG
jgi:hypothetical protein